MMNTFDDVKYRFEFLADQLQKKGMVIRHFCLEPPISEKTLREHEKKWKRKLPEELRRFFLECAERIYFEWEEWGHGVLGANSNHTGGVNVGLADGSVQFVSDTIDYGSLQNIEDGEYHSGRSPWGAWGAAASINGGESKSIP